MKEKLVFVWSPRPLDALWLVSWEHGFQHILQDLVINLCPCTLLQNTPIGTNFCLCTPPLFERGYSYSLIYCSQVNARNVPQVHPSFFKVQESSWTHLGLHRGEPVKLKFRPKCLGRAASSWEPCNKYWGQRDSQLEPWSSLVKAGAVHQAAPICVNPTLTHETGLLLSGKRACEGRAESGCVLAEGAALVMLWFVRGSSSLVLQGWHFPYLFVLCLALHFYVLAAGQCLLSQQLHWPIQSH